MKTTHPDFPITRQSDGRAMINLGSSARIAPGWTNVDFSWIIRVGRHRHLCKILRQRGFLSEERYQRILQLDPQMVVWDLRKGIPFQDKTFDVVYHSHVLEHIDREAAPEFIRECYRVLAPGGIIRVVVPDFESLARNYLASLDRMPNHASIEEHTFAVSEMIDQMVVRIPRDREGRKWIVRSLENLLIGDTAKNGVLHRWMYDRFSLEALLKECGFEDIQQHNEKSSKIAGWPEFHLDSEPDGSSYKPGSLYMEGRRCQ